MKIVDERETQKKKTPSKNTNKDRKEQGGTKAIAKV